MDIDDKLRKEIGLPLADLLKKFVDTGNTSEPQMVFYTGIVVDNNDPDKLGRCKIRVYGVFEKEIGNTELPWAIPDFNFIGGKKGSFVVPPKDTILKVYFDNNDYHTPRYTTKVIDKNNLDFDAGKDEDYPNTMVFFETDQGEYFKINSKTLTSTYKHASGTTISIDKDGNINIQNKSAGSGTAGNLVIDIEGNVNLSVDGDVNLETTNAYVNAEKTYLGMDETTSTTLPLAGVVTGECLDPITGVPFPDKSLNVFARKV